MEAGCKSIVAQRLKCSGMEWTIRGANAIIALRCMIISNRFEDYWCDHALDQPHKSDAGPKYFLKK